jgi:ParB-like chromosome segregation protein Spo0J
MQIAENVQREGLDLQDEVKAIRQLHDHLKTVQAVADTVKKSAGVGIANAWPCHIRISIGERKI